MPALPRALVVALATFAALAAGCRAGTDAAPAAPAIPLDGVALDVHPAYTDLVPIESGPAGRGSLREVLRRGGSLVSLAELRAAPARYLGGAIERDSFDLRDRLDEVVALVERNPGERLAITWEGGLARTAADRSLATARRTAAGSWPADLPRPERDDDDPLHPDRVLR